MLCAGQEKLWKGNMQSSHDIDKMILILDVIDIELKLN